MNGEQRKIQKMMKLVIHTCEPNWCNVSGRRAGTKLGSKE